MRKYSHWLPKVTIDSHFFLGQKKWLPKGGDQILLQKLTSLVIMGPIQIDPGTLGTWGTLD